jgi:malonate-semialdehyde dehydrogenase (acetylating)/methylmalonate-semialdehyde dehydrogenase
VVALLENPEVKGISFVGSSTVARIVYATCGETGKRVQSLGGAKNFLVAMPDMNIEGSIPNIISSAYGCAGQRCLASGTIIAVGEVYEPLRDALVGAAGRIKVGYGLHESVQMGPVISKAHKEKVLGYIEKGIEEGAKLLLDGRSIAVEGHENGYFIGPTIFDEVNPEMVIAREEIFGPVIAILRAKDFEEAMEIVRASNYGNAASIFTTSGKWAREFTYRAEASMMGINLGIAAPMAFFPFGGTRESFFGDVKAHGSEVIDFFTDKKVIITRWI